MPNVPCDQLDFFNWGNVETSQYLLINAFVDVGHGFEAQDGEDDDAGVDGSHCVGDGHDDDVTHAVVVGCVVAAERDQRAERQSERVEDLRGRV